MGTTSRGSQERLLLEKVKKAKGGTATRTSLAPAKPAKAFVDVGLSDRAAAGLLVDDLVQRGLLSENRGKRKTDIKYALTETGSRHLTELSAPARTHDNQKLFEYQCAQVLLNLFCADGHEATIAAVKKAPKPLELQNAKTVEWILYELTKQGAIEDAGAKKVRLTETGRQKLVSAEFYPNADVPKMKGQLLTQLMRLATAAKPQADAEERPERAPADIQAPPTTVPAYSESRLEQFLLDESRRLADEEFSASRLVPIHRLRARAREKLGATSAEHRHFDPLLLRLRADGRVRLISINDRSRASREELDDSIHGIDEIFFYVGEAE